MTRPPIWSFLFALPLTVAATACADSAALGDEDTAAASASGEAGDGEVEEFEWVPALGIGITEVEANQGTRVPIGGPDGAWIDGGGRNTFLVSDRDTLIRAHWEVADGWQPHEVRAVLTVVAPTGTTEHEQIVVVEGDSTPTSLARTFYFGLVAEVGETSPGTSYQLELFEKDTEQDASLPELARVNPSAGAMQVGFETSPMEMKVMLVPIHYVADGKDRRPDLSEDNLDVFLDHLYEQNPVQDVQYQIHSEVPYTQVMNNLGSLLPIMAQLKDQEGADSNIYYHALIDIDCAVAGCGSSGVAGIAYLSNPTQSDSLQRVAATIYYDIESSAETFVHEIGHNQGFSHVECPDADAAGPDPSYPYTDGKIGNWGFGIRTFGLHNPTASHDYMTYCSNTWASDWTFNKAYQRIKTLTSWDYGAPAPDPGDASELIGSERLVGAIYPDGTEEWFTLSGGVRVDELSPGEGVDFEYAGHTVRQPAAVHTLSDDETQWVIVPMPDGLEFDAIDSLDHLRDGQVRRSFDRHQVRRGLGDPQ